MKRAGPAANEEKRVETRPIGPQDALFVRKELIRNWASPLILSRARPYQADELPGLVALLDGTPAGHITWMIDAEGPECEIVTLASVVEGRGVGSALLEGALQRAKQAACRRAFLTTSNDNLRALGFYQRRGWRIVAVYPGMMDRYREVEKAIPEIGMNGIPLRDELELEFPLL